MVILSIIILSYNTKNLTIKCIESVVNQYKKKLEQGEIEIIVVDNASSDASVEMIEEKFISRHSGKRSKRTHPESLTMIGDSGQARMTQSRNIIIVKNRKNVGFSKGCNIGAKASMGKYVLFLNSDTEVLDKGFLKMIEFFDGNQKVGILGGRLLNPDNSPQPSTGKFYNLFNLFLMLIGTERLLLLRKSPKNIQKVDWVSGACLMVRKTVFDQLKGFDENFFMYIEDVELCFRANKLGFLTYFYPDIKIIHKELGSSNRSFAIIHIYKGLLYFYSKHKSRFQYIVAKQMLKIKAKAGIFVGTVIGNSSLIETYRQALRFKL